MVGAFHTARRNCYNERVIVAVTLQWHAGDTSAPQEAVRGGTHARLQGLRELAPVVVLVADDAQQVAQAGPAVSPVPPQVAQQLRVQPRLRWERLCQAGCSLAHTSSVEWGCEPHPGHTSSSRNPDDTLTVVQPQNLTACYEIHGFHKVVQAIGTLRKPSP